MGPRSCLGWRGRRGTGCSFCVACKQPTQGLDSPREDLDSPWRDLGEGQVRTLRRSVGHTVRLLCRQGVPVCWPCPPCRRFEPYPTPCTPPHWVLDLGPSEVSHLNLNPPGTLMLTRCASILPTLTQTLTPKVTPKVHAGVLTRQRAVFSWFLSVWDR